MPMVLSTTSGAPAACAALAAASRSTRSRVGFAGVSTNTIRVSGLIAAASAACSAAGTNVEATPSRVKYFSSRPRDGRGRRGETRAGRGIRHGTV